MIGRPGRRTSSVRAAATSRHTGVGIWRRTLDVVGAGIGLALLVPLMATIALAIKVSGSGPFLFRQVRLTGGRREFTILKFRTMRVTQGGPEVTAAGDARITTVGDFLRRTHLDELPQLVNVLRGDMTLVGPRPETPALAARYPPECQWVLEHRPGLTGPTQVRSGDLNRIPVDVVDLEQWYVEHLVPQRVVMDATYLDHPSVAATLRVLIDTANHLISGSDATGSSQQVTKGSQRALRRTGCNLNPRRAVRAGESRWRLQRHRPS
jgi:lipopolysaccharide/colanic/teichoic acid biosynthesis glycosyltransferase